MQQGIIDANIRVGASFLEFTQARLMPGVQLLTGDISLKGYF